MATITVKDLPESTELDRHAMLAIAGGARLRTGAALAVRPAAPTLRLFDLAPARAAGQAGAKPPSR